MAKRETNTRLKKSGCCKEHIEKLPEEPATSLDSVENSSRLDDPLQALSEDGAANRSCCCK